MKKILSLVLVLVLSFGMVTSSFADSLTKTSSPEEIDEFIEVMLRQASNTEIKKAGVTEVFVEHKGLTGKVTIEEEALMDMPSTRSTVIYDNIPDGSRVITTTLKADVLLGGEMILKSYYDMKYNGTYIDATDTDESFSPPLGYTNGGTSSYIAIQAADGSYFKTVGSYTMLAVDIAPLTIKVIHSVTLIGDGEIRLNYYKEL